MPMTGRRFQSEQFSFQKRTRHWRRVQGSGERSRRQLCTACPQAMHNQITH